MSDHARRTMDDPAWSAWFDLQYDVCAEVDKLVGERVKGQTPSMKAAVVSSVIEHLAEQQRSYIELSLPAAEPHDTEGDLVVLVQTNDPHTRLKPGSMGTVLGIGPQSGEVRVQWDDGSTLSMLTEEGDLIVNVTKESRGRLR